MINLTMLVRNRPRLTGQALNSLAATVDLAVNPLTILDDRSDEPLHGGLGLFWGALRNELPLGTGNLRNLVIKESEHRHGRGRYLYLSDNDVCFQPNWLATLVACYEIVQDEFAVLGAVNHPFHQPIATTSPLDPAGHVVDEVQALATQSWLLSWETWDRFGPFVSTPVDRVCQSEDVEFTVRVRAAGLRVGVVSPALVVATGITNTFGEPIPGADAVRALVPEGIVCE